MKMASSGFAQNPIALVCVCTVWLKPLACHFHIKITWLFDARV